ncbi:MAG: sulfur carrier protein ThiS [Bacteroidota bacterium]
MKIKLNDKELEISHSITLEELLLKEINLSPDKKGVAVAVNDNIIPKNDWKNLKINDKDEILVIIAAQGG